jgi:importin subunit alpha-6/7
MSKFIKRIKKYQLVGLEALKFDREEGLIQLRKKRRQEHMSKKRGDYIQDPKIPDEFHFPIEYLPSQLKIQEPSILTPGLTSATRLNQLLKILINTESIESIEYSLDCLRTLFNKNKFMPTSYIFSDKLIKIFFALLNCEVLKIKSLVLWCLINTFNNDQNVIKKFVDKGIILKLVQIVRADEDYNIIENAAWALGNIVGEGIEFRDLVLETGVWKDLLNLTTLKEYSLKKTAVWVVSNLCKGKPSISIDIAKEIVAFLPNGIHSADIEIMFDSLFTLAYLSEENSVIIDEIIKLNLVPFLLGNIRHYSTKIQSPVLKIITNIANGTRDQLKALIDMGLIIRLLIALESPNLQVKIEILRIFSDLTFNDDDFVLKIVQDSEIRRIIDMLDNPNNNLKKYSLFAICNALHKRNGFITKALLDLNILPKIIKFFKVEDSNLVLHALKGLRFVFEIYSDIMSNEKWEEFLKDFNELGGIASLEDLQFHKNEQIFREAQALIEEFIGKDEHPVLTKVTEFNFS